MWVGVAPWFGTGGGGPGGFRCEPTHHPKQVRSARCTHAANRRCDDLRRRLERTRADLSGRGTLSLIHI
eukprot:1236603-Rhodomonas_salina.1